MVMRAPSERRPLRLRWHGQRGSSKTLLPKRATELQGGHAWGTGQARVRATKGKQRRLLSSSGSSRAAASSGMPAAAHPGLVLLGVVCCMRPLCRLS